MASSSELDDCRGVTPKKWPSGLDDLRRQPDRLVTAADLMDLGVAETEEDLKKLPPQLRLPGGRNVFSRGWEARTILLYIGAGLYLPPSERGKRKQMSAKAV
jgi:hypothetical protein